MSHGTLTSGFWIKREKEKDKLRMGGGSWSINLDELPKAGVKWVQYITEKDTYCIEIEKAFEHGFKRVLGGELKLVVPIKYWEIVDKKSRD